MDSFFGIGLPELVLILILAGLVMGPQRIREVARFLGRFVAQVQGLSRQFTQQLNSELDSLESDDVRGAMDEMKELRRQLSDLRNQVSIIPTGVSQVTKKAVEEGEATLANPESGKPAGDQTSNNGNVTAAGDNSYLPRPLEIPDDPE